MGDIPCDETLFDQLRALRKKIAAQRDLAETTILGHLAVALFVGEQIDLRRLLSVEEENRIRKVVEAEPAAHPARLKDRLGGNFGYGHLRLMLAAMGQDPSR